MSTSSIRKYDHISPYGYIKDDKVYLKGYGDFQDREIGIVRQTDEASIEYFVNRFEMVTQKVDVLKNAILEAENKGSYLMKLIHMRTYLATYNGLGDFTKLFLVLEDLENDIRAYIERNRGKNYDIKSSLLAEAEQLAHSSDWRNATERFKELKMNWIKTGSAHKGLNDEMTDRFNEAIRVFFNNRNNFYKEQARIMKQRLTNYQNIFYKVRQLTNSPINPDNAAKIKELQKAWKEVGKVPMNKIAKLNNDFRRITTKYFNELSMIKPVAPTIVIKKKTGIELKKELLEEVENMLLKDTTYNITTIKNIQNAWKDLGKLPQVEDKDLNLKFRIVCNEIFESHFLDRMAKHLHPDFTEKSLAEQVRIKTTLLKESLDKDEADLEEYNIKHGAVLSSNMNAAKPEYFEIFQERNNFVNRIKTKQRILKKLEDRILAIK